MRFHTEAVFICKTIEECDVPEEVSYGQRLWRASTAQSPKHLASSDDQAILTPNGRSHGECPEKTKKPWRLASAGAHCFQSATALLQQAVRNDRRILRMLVNVIRKILCSDQPVTLPSEALQDANAL